MFPRITFDFKIMAGQTRIRGVCASPSLIISLLANGMMKEK
jgi:uncharacterized protein (DUF433 family)